MNALTLDEVHRLPRGTLAHLDYINIPEWSQEVVISKHGPRATFFRRLRSYPYFEYNANYGKTWRILLNTDTEC